MFNATISTPQKREWPPPPNGYERDLGPPHITGVSKRGRIDGPMPRYIPGGPREMERGPPARHGFGPRRSPPHYRSPSRRPAGVLHACKAPRLLSCQLLLGRQRHAWTTFITLLKPELLHAIQDNIQHETCSASMSGPLSCSSPCRCRDTGILWARVAGTQQPTSGDTSRHACLLFLGWQALTRQLQAEPGRSIRKFRVGLHIWQAW